MSILQAKEPNGWPLEKIFANNHAVEWVRGFMTLMSRSAPVERQVTLLGGRRIEMEYLCETLYRWLQVLKVDLG
jgi:hypothetical protein